MPSQLWTILTLAGRPSHPAEEAKRWVDRARVTPTLPVIFYASLFDGWSMGDLPDRVAPTLSPLDGDTDFAASLWWADLVAGPAPIVTDTDAHQTQEARDFASLLLAATNAYHALDIERTVLVHRRVTGPSLDDEAIRGAAGR